MIMYAYKKITGELILDEEDKKSIRNTLDILEILEDLVNENDYTLDQIVNNHYINYYDFLEDLIDNTQYVYELILDDINEHNG